MHYPDGSLLRPSQPYKGFEVPDSISTMLLAKIGRLYIINLVSRPDRRQEMTAELADIGINTDHPKVTFFAAVKPESAGTFPSIGARGCFMSHLGVLRDARDRKLEAVLILEDDATFSAGPRAQLSRALTDLDAADWAIAYLGYRLIPGSAPDPAPTASPHWQRLATDMDVQTTHAMLIHGRAIEPLIAYFERLMERPSGHPDGGPMHVDGAYSWFRRSHPNLQTVATSIPCVLQRASKSDIARGSWKDKIPFIDTLRQIKNRLQRKT